MAVRCPMRSFPLVRHSRAGGNPVITRTPLDSRLRGNDVLAWLMGLAWLIRPSRKPLSRQRFSIATWPGIFFLATKNHKSHKPDDLLNRTFKLFVDFVPGRSPFRTMHSFALLPSHSPLE